MSASIIQKNSAFAVNVGAGSVAVTLPNPIGAGSKIIIACATVETDGSGAGIPTVTVLDDKGNGYSPGAYNSSGQGLFANTYLGTVSDPGVGAQTYTMSYTAPVGQSAYTFLAGICIYEVSGVAGTFTNESASQALSGLHKISDLSATISSLTAGTFGNLFVTIGAFTFTSLADATTVAAGSGWTLDGRQASNGTFGAMAIAFESQFVAPGSNPTALFSGDGNSTELDGTIVVGAYLLTDTVPGGGPTPPSSSTTFLGSVRVLSNPPSGKSSSNSPYLGSVRVVSGVPANIPNPPYLGSVCLGTPTSAGDGNPALGDVVVVTEIPANATDVWLGFVEEN